MKLSSVHSFPAMLALLFGISCQEPSLLSEIPSSQSGIDFQNTLVEDEFMNILTFEYFYNGAGVAVADFNADGLDDLFFTSNMGNSEIYINKGNFTFENITASSGIETQGKWATGVSIIDINQDGLRDIYICFSGPYGARQRTNELYINQGDLTFREEAEAYGLADQGFSTQAAFFDFDRDGDLDLYLLNNMTDETGPNIIRPKRINGEMLNTDKLYRNNGDHTFTDISLQAGITLEGYGLGVSIADINQDEWPDIYVSNDYLSNDLLYINQKDGTFQNMAGKAFPHTSYSAMGNDIADFNNDGLLDIISVDMLPPDNLRQKLMFGKTGNDRYISEIKSGYEPQLMRNTLQLNRGFGKEGLPLFSDISYLAGLSATDWSWAPLWVDLDNDGWKDLLITNGYPRDITNRDFVDYKSGFARLSNRQVSEALKELEGAHTSNYIFQNRGDLAFSDVSKHWGIELPSYSSGAAYADFNNDGSQDLVINNTYSPATLYQNNSSSLKGNHYLKIKLEGLPPNIQALGTKVHVYSGGQQQFYEHYLSRGYQSSVSETIHFGLGQEISIDSLKVLWPNGDTHRLVDLPADQTLILEQRNDPEDKIKGKKQPEKKLPGMMEELPAFKHKERYYADFNLQPLLPHMHSQLGPGAAVGDINGDGLEDMYFSGAHGQAGQIFIQNAKGNFDIRSLPEKEAAHEDMGALIFDADGDGDMDLYVVSGGNEFKTADPLYQDRLYLNKGDGDLMLSQGLLPEARVSGSCVIGGDFDKDGDLDLFIGGRLEPNQYPLPGKSQLLLNQGGKFEDITDRIAPGLAEVGMVTSALWSDYNNDGWLDLWVVGEWMEITLFENQKGKLVRKKEIPGLSDTSGWWNSIIGVDLNKDGWTDYVLGNLGLNSRYQTEQDQPLQIHWADFDQNGKVEAIISRIWEGQRFPVHPRDDLFQQLPSLKKKYRTYADYGKADLNSIIEAGLDKDPKMLQAATFSSLVLYNKKGTFEAVPLPAVAQVAPIYGILAADFNGDGMTDLFLSGNNFSAEAINGPYDASYGLMLHGEPKGGFTVPQQNPWISGDQKGLIQLKVKQKSFGLALKNNQDTEWLDIFPAQMPEFNPPEVKGAAYVELHYQTGDSRKKEYYWGAGYLTQQPNNIIYEKGLNQIKYFDAEGNQLAIYPVQSNLEK
ncbi:VCBS repeat-containing protein [Cyclobacterium plantarum]|uniref:VCBS repeat-containing protein n=1 Tax=Cyclobacterium plantarum TaxID=2716263 RepID=UPI003F717F01